MPSTMVGPGDGTVKQTDSAFALMCYGVVRKTSIKRVITVADSTVERQMGSLTLVHGEGGRSGKVPEELTSKAET